MDGVERKQYVPWKEIRRKSEKKDHLHREDLKLEGMKHQVERG